MVKRMHGPAANKKGNKQDGNNEKNVNFRIREE